MSIKTMFTKRIAIKMNENDDFNQFVLDSIYRHLSGDWGDVSPADADVNSSDPLYALSAYKSPDGMKIWLKQDYNVLTVLFPDEY